ncbi:Methionine ABC transporter ATP-binding protein [Enhygromyxa salina]|uniref:Methionine ABC transporter ATP-binding protein n=1 Tax=Enhygromyxa salina TaxID=215803 RepID=A0A0C2D062_9BACT|nr:Methionine ABC transporter ATP-binding protein [Enhygromyxa salina]
MLAGSLAVVGCADPDQGADDRYGEAGSLPFSTSDSDSSGDGDGDGDGDGGPKFDMDENDTEGMGCEGEPGGPGPGGEIEFSNIWIANSPDGTISKIDTLSATEIGRFQVTPQPANNVLVGPSRTSVSLYGDMAVADRSGGLAKIFARQEDCVDANNNGQIDTSTNNVPRPYGEDECLAWRIQIPRMPGVYDDRRGPRAVQWTLPDGIESCDFTGAKVWVAFCNEANNDGTVWLVDGQTGDVDVEIPIPGMMCEMMGPYGGGLDKHNNFWFVENDTRKALYVAKYGCEPGGSEECWEVYDRPDANMDPYGITVDSTGRVWMAGQNNSLYYYDSVNGDWANFKADLDAFFANKGNPTNILRGLMMDSNEVLWIATVQEFGGGQFPGVLKVDTTQDPFVYEYFSKETLGDQLQHAAGISIDVEGYVWLVDTFSNAAYKIHPDNPSNYTRVEGLNQPYTYSDMTGFALNLVGFPPEG